MREEVRIQMSKVKKECFTLAQILGYDRMELKYSKQKKFSDDGILDLYNIQHFYSS